MSIKDYGFEGYMLDSATGRLTDPNCKEIALRPQSMQVLMVLAENAGNVVSRDDLIAAVWPELNVTDDSLIQCIGDIRRAFGDAGHDAITTIPKKGYRLAAGTLPAVVQPKGRLGNGSKRAMISAAVVLLLLVSWFGLRGSSDPDLAYKGNGDAVNEQSAERGPSVAVMPFEDLTGDERWARLGRGLATDIADELARNSWLFVTSPETSQNQLGKMPVEVGRALNVRFILNGTIQFDADTLRISSRLNDAATGEIYWTETWTRPAENIFAIQDEILARVGSSLTGTYSGEIGVIDLETAKRKPTTSLSAYEHFLIGTELKQTYEQQSLRTGIWHLERSVELDPHYARAWVSLSLSKFFLGDTLDDPEEIHALYEQSTTEALRALEEDPNDPDALWSTAITLADNGEPEKGRQNLIRAVELAPNNADVLASVAWTGSSGGMLDDMALELILRAIDLNPDHPDWYWVALGEAAFYEGDYDLAVDALHKAPEMMVVEWDLAVAEYIRGNIDQAKVHAANYRRLAPGMTITEQFGGDTTQPRNQQEIEIGRVLGIPFDVSEL